MTHKNRMKWFVSLIIMVCLSVSAGAQTINEVVEAFNAGAEDANSGNFETAITKFEECIELATTLGAEGDEMKQKAEQQIPALHYNLALASYKAKEYEAALEKFEETVAACDTYGNEELKTKSMKYIPALHYALANKAYKEEDYESSLSHYDMAIEINPNYLKAYYGKGLVYQKNGDEENMIAAFEKVIEMGTAAGDDKTVPQASKKLRDHYVIKGVTALKAEDYTDAIGLFNSSLEYDNEYTETYYYLTVIYNKQEEYDKAVENANAALEYDTSEPDKKARIYYELGNAYYMLVEYEKACEAYKNALHEPFTNSAKHKIENVLNCQ